MKRIHISINTEAEKFETSLSFYSTLFDTPPTKRRDQYAKWMLEDPKVNFVVEVKEMAHESSGIHHLGIQVDDSESLATMRDNLKRAGAPLLEVGETVCCFSHSVKDWTMDPSGVKWESFRSLGDTENYGKRTSPESLGCSAKM